MSFKAKLALLALSTMLALYAVVGGLLARRTSAVAKGNPYVQLKIFNEVVKRIANDYVDEPDLGKVRIGALRGLADGLDPYCAYLSPEQATRFKPETMAAVPFGMVVSKYAGFAYVVAVVPGSPAAQAGVKTGDFIEYVNTVATRDVSLYEIMDLLVNVPDGRPVEVTVLRPGLSKGEKHTLKAGPFQSVVESRMESPDTGYIKVGLLTKGKAEQVAAAIRQLQQRGAQKLLLDLRESAHGELAEGVALASMFVSSGVVARTLGAGNAVTTVMVQPGATMFNGKVIVLTDRSTAGPAEVIAAAIRDNQRGEIVGEKTFGAGSQQALFPLRDGSALLLTTLRYAPATGKSFMEEPVKPSVEVKVASVEPSLPDIDADAPSPAETPEEPKKVTPPSEDTILKRALELLKGEAKQAHRAIPKTQLPKAA
ncbi:PDZ domain-containing protein [Chloracidobacterium validum]|uniref:PDZ domain-containing protein n=1 Tax=Chloracidobacterium validum TaxID=2821543 RepID=A0ABX8BD01_9BACT|nr:S41 family peptidase [Chloracidobacterium validum]QUW03715.1 PDZ domain-containing protein [Chloracidobacterium validum]